MKKLLLLLVLSSFIFYSYSQTLFTYGDHPVTTTEFLSAYNKNKAAGASDPQAIRDYLDLYIKFKLKVQAAKDSHLDTLPSLAADLQNFRNQVQDGYLKDEKEVNRLVDEAFTRSQKDIHATYYFVKEDPTVDSAKARAAINEVARELKKKTPDEEILSKVNAGNTSLVKKGDAGFITVFSLPYPLENIVYSLKPGQSGVPYHTRKGWYIFKNAGERHAVGTITVAQILFAFPQGAVREKEEAKRLADSVYHLLEHGGDLAILAKQFSDDRTTFMNGGLMPEFGTAKYDSVFENHAFSLKKDGEIAAPFETRFGYHILKRIAAAPVPATKSDEAYMAALKQQVLNDSRIQIAKEKFLAHILPVIGYTKNPVNEETLWRITDSFLTGHELVVAGNVNARTTLFLFNNKEKVTVGDWTDYLKNSGKAGPGSTHPTYKDLFRQFIQVRAISNYASRLQEYNPAFKSQIEEFKEGNMLFEIMQRKVWGKASADTSGLRRFYETHKENYFWRSSADAVIFSCSSKTVADHSIVQLKKGKTWRQVVSENPSQIQADSGRFELGQIPVADRTNFTPGLITLPVINRNDGTAVFAQILKIYPSHEPRNFDDARGLVINDYQNDLEEKWVELLKKKYPVKVNEKELQSILHTPAGFH